MGTTETDSIEQVGALQTRNRRLKRLLALACVLFVVIVVAEVIGRFPSLTPRIELRRSTLLQQNMTMLEVEQLLGKPDRVEIKEGRIEGAQESPKIITWVYSAYRVTDSGETFGQPGHINFVPLRFTNAGWNDAQADKAAREYGEQADVFRTISFSGSFPVDRNDWEGFGLFDGIPLKNLTQ